MSLGLGAELASIQLHRVTELETPVEYTGVAGIFCSPHWLSAYPSTKLETPVDYKTFKHLSTLPSADKLSSP